jgi:hypothetical protein
MTTRSYTGGDAARLTTAFRAQIRKALGLPLCRKVDSDNAVRPMHHCASHDHCDANVYMLAAFAETFDVPEDEVPLELQSTCDVINAAWERAKGLGFGTEIREG